MSHTTKLVLFSILTLTMGIGWLTYVVIDDTYYKSPLRLLVISLPFILGAIIWYFQKIPGQYQHPLIVWGWGAFNVAYSCITVTMIKTLIGFIEILKTTYSSLTLTDILRHALLILFPLVIHTVVMIWTWKYWIRYRNKSRLRNAPV